MKFFIYNRGKVASSWKAFVERLTFVNWKYIGYGLLCLVTFIFVIDAILIENYRALESKVVYDRVGKIISILPNSKNEYSTYADALPPPVEKLLTQKEDRFFYFHPGINPMSTLRSFFDYIKTGRGTGGSTISQQLSKNLFGNETNRTLGNKIWELLGAAALELFHSKKQIIIMYGNTVYMGNNIQGLYQASLDYFGKELDELDQSEILMLIATLSNPSGANPWKATNKTVAQNLAHKLGISFNENASAKNPTQYIHSRPVSFELKTLGSFCEDTCQSTVDSELNEKLRAILKRTIDSNWDKGVRNGAIVVIKIPENEVLAIVGSPHPQGFLETQNINMAIEPRPIGSTAKPFIYLRSFELGLRPYTLVEDREYKFPIATGFPIYPKNYDGLYHGNVTLHEALAQSYNVPAVKTLEYVGLDDFYNFLERKLEFSPLSDLGGYQYGIALGGLEMDPLTLAYYFTLFPQNGRLRPLKIYKDETVVKPPMSRIESEKQISEPRFVELVTKILNDRLRGVEQFGLESSLNLSQNNYAVKTGTSRDYHDSWTVGYTPDFVVAVWIGNAENEPLKHVSGQSGAGRVWHDAMELLFASPYNLKSQFSFENIGMFMIGGNLEFGLKDDFPDEHRSLLTTDSLIISPHHGDSVLFEENTVIPLRASREVTWYIDDQFLGHGRKLDWTPQAAGRYKVIAQKENGNPEIIYVNLTL